MDEIDVEALGSSLRELSESIGELGDGQDVGDLIKAIHGPGWTTLPEHELVSGITRSLIHRSTT
jgi:hypothetical protein